MLFLVSLVCVPMLVVLFLAVTVGLPAQLVMEGLANGMPGAVFAGVILLVVIWGGIFAAFGR